MSLICTSALPHPHARLSLSQIKVGDLAKNWFWSYTGNLVGSLAMVAAVVYSGVMAGNMMPVNAAVVKSSLPLGVAVMRAIFANWCVRMRSTQALTRLFLFQRN